MNFFAIAIPILPGKTDEVYAFTKELMSSKHEEFVQSRQALGVHERAFLQKTPMGDMVIVTLEGENTAEAFKKFGQAQDDFTNWFVEKVKELHGIDIRATMDIPLPELVADSQA